MVDILTWKPRCVLMMISLGGTLLISPQAIASQKTGVASRSAQQPTRAGKTNPLESQVRQLEIEDGDREYSASDMSTPQENTPLSQSMQEQITELLVDEDITRGFTFHGYARAGFGVNDRGNAKPAFRAPNAQAKFRLGNESETYIETQFGFTFPDLPLSDGVEFAIYFRPSYVVPNHLDATKSTFSVREAYGTAKGVLRSLPEAQFWAGQRFYQRWDLHQIDYFYLDMSGYGGGIENIPFGGFAKLSIAWLGGSIDTLQGSSTLAPKSVVKDKNSIDIRLSSINLPGSEGSIWVKLAHVDNTTQPNGSNVQTIGNYGLAVGLIYQLNNILGGYNRTVFQFGTGAAANFRATESDFSLYTNNQQSAGGYVSEPLVVNYNNAWQLRLLNDLTIQPNKYLSLQATLVYNIYDMGFAKDSETEWLAVGLRPHINIGKYWSLIFEAGVDHTHSRFSNQSGELYKFTVAPEISPDRGYFSRPSLRLFATYALWSDDFRGQIATGSYGDDTEGLSVGVQVEAWW